MRAICIVALSALLAAAGGAHAQQSAQSPVKRVLPRGKDGDNLYYQVVCRDRTTASLVVRDTAAQICAQPHGQARTCRADWTLPRAAEFACR